MVGKVSRDFKQSDTIVEVANNRGQIIRVGGRRVVIMAGPSIVESREQVLSVAESVAASGASLLCGSVSAVSLSDSKFSCDECVNLLKEAGETVGLPVAIEVDSLDFISFLNESADVIVVASCKMSDHGFLKSVAALKKSVILKRGLKSSVEEFLDSAEILLDNGCQNVILCEGGVASGESKILDLSSIPLLKKKTHLPVIVDPCHFKGDSHIVQPMTLAAISSGVDGVVLDVQHGKQKTDDTISISPNSFDKLMHDIEAMTPVLGKAVAYIRTSKKEKIVCAYSGKKGAYAEQAVGRYFDSSDVTALAVDSFGEIFQAVLDGKADYGMVPIENSLAGSVYQNYDNFCRYEDVTIVGAVTLNIRHALLGVKGASVDDIETVYSHPQGFGQCKRFLDAHKKWNHIDSVSTATAAKFVADKGDKTQAAIASTVNAQIYNMEIIQEDIEDDPNNFTRFLVIQANSQKKMGQGNVRANMASFIFKTKNEPGALYKTLGVFSQFQVNLNRLESRPMEGHAWNYWFYADAELSNILSSSDEDVGDYVERLMAGLKMVVEDIRLLGVYPENRP